MVIFPSSGPGVWKALFEKAAEMGLKGNRLLLVVLVVAATIWVSLGVSPLICVTFVVVVYSTHHGFEFTGLYLQKRADQRKLTLKKSEYSGFVLSKRQERSKKELPASSRCKAPLRLSGKRSNDPRAT